MEEKKKHGGYRVGSGRKHTLPDGTKPRNMRLTDAEFLACKALVAKMRGNDQNGKN